MIMVDPSFLLNHLRSEDGQWEEKVLIDDSKRTKDIEIISPTTVQKWAVFRIEDYHLQSVLQRLPESRAISLAFSHF